MNYGKTRKDMERKYKYDIYVIADDKHSNGGYTARATAWTRTKEESDSKVIHACDSRTLYQFFASSPNIAKCRALNNLRVVLEKEWKRTQYDSGNGQFYMFGQKPLKHGEAK